MKLWDCIKQEKTYVIAEMSGNHGGSLSNALKLVAAAKEAGADCLKTQTYTADTLTLDCESPLFTVKGGLWDGMRLYDLYRNAFTPWEWQQTIKRECESLSMDFLSSPFDVTAVDFLEGIGTQAYKIASPELVDLPLIQYAAKTGKPLILSCGMASAREIQEAADTVRRYGCGRFVLLKCCSEYPANFADMNLSVLPDMKERFHCPVGLSDHSMGSLAAVTGAALGACVVEKHLCISRKEKSADSAFSMEPEEFGEMVRQIRKVEQLRGRVTYEPGEGEKRGLRNRRSLFAVAQIHRGECFTAENIRSIRPGQGLAPKYYEKLLGKRAAVDLERGTPLSWGAVEGGEFSWSL